MSSPSSLPPSVAGCRGTYFITPNALGPDLPQQVVDGDRQGGLTVEEPRVFYRLPMEISEHWFGEIRRATLDDVRKHRDSQSYSMLVYGCFRDFLRTM